MTELFHDAQPRAGEDLQATVALDEGDGNAPSLLAGFSTLPTAESRDTLTNPESLIGTTDSTAASPLADKRRIRSGRECCGGQ